jgi:hypothetical protein
MQADDAQTWFAPHAFPQPLQWRGSDVMSTHSPPQSVRPNAQPGPTSAPALSGDAVSMGRSTPPSEEPPAPLPPVPAPVPPVPVPAPPEPALAPPEPALAPPEPPVRAPPVPAPPFGDEPEHETTRNSNATDATPRK